MPDTAGMRTAVVVEDDRDLRHLLAEVFESAGFSVVTAGNGIDGVRAVFAYDPLITTLDVSMPGIDGFEAARRIRQRNTSTHIIMLTAMGEESDMVLGLAAGADDYIVKPFRPREFRARIDAVLRRPRPASGTAPTTRMQESAGPSFPRTSSITVPTQAERDRDARERAEDYSRADDESDRPRRAARAARAERAQHDDDFVEIPRRDDGAFRPDADQDDDIIIAEVDGPSTDVERHDPTVGWLSHRDLRSDPETGTTVIGETRIVLSPTEAALLQTLLESRRRIRSRADLTLVLRGESYVTSYFVGEADKKAVEVQMASLRRKLGDAGLATPRYIEAVRDVGYRLTPEVDLLG